MAINERAYTDPAMEIANLMEKMRQWHPGSSASGFSILAQQLQLPEGSPELYELLGVIASRLVALKDFASTVEDHFLDERLVKAVSEVADRVGRLTGPDVLSGQWKGAVANYLQDNDITTLRFFARTARAHRPLRIVEDNERDLLIARINEAMEEISDDKDTPAWAKAPLRDGLRRLKTVILRLEFFGHEAAIEQLLLLQSKTLAASTALEKEAPGKQSKSVLAVAGAIATVAALFTAPDQGFQAYQRYLGWTNDTLTTIQKQISPPQKLLAPPQKQQDTNTKTQRLKRRAKNVNQ